VTNGLEADVFYTSSYIGVLPENVMQEMYAPISLAAAPQPLREIPILLPNNDDKVRRAIAAFDRNSTVDGHKIGVIYMADGQTHETPILANTFGSAAYTDFINDLGTLVRLRGATFNTQGLDRSDDTDGQYAYCWRDRSTELVYHVTTMMPTDLVNDSHCINKKRHIGNDYVNIVWNDSGEPFEFNTFPSQFNYVYIVITPELQASFTNQRQSSETAPSATASPTANTGNISHHEHTKMSTKLFYRVQVVSAPGFPSISPAAETKLISARALAPFVRLLALNASYFSLVWSARDGGEIVSPWRNRLREIIRLRERYGATGVNDTVGSVAGAAANQGRSGSPLSAPPSAGGLLGSGAVGRSSSQRGSFMGD
jgi:hypothetical protein